jgi:putative transposase
MKNWPHAPSHWSQDKGTYMITCGTYQKEHLFYSNARLELIQSTIIFLTHKYNWFLKAWAVFPNHYHFIASTVNDPKNLPKLIAEIHRITAFKINERDNTEGRTVWYQYWDTYLSHHVSYMARMNYVINNPVKHKIVDLATNYPYCSASWFDQNAPNGFKKSIYSLKTDKVNVYDEF